MNYRCPQCKQMLNVRKLFFRDISACDHCGQKVVLGDFLAFFMAAVTMMIIALTALYVVSQEQEYYIAGGYAVSAGMLAGLVVLLLLGRATPFRRVGRKRSAAPVEPGQPAPKA